MTLVTCVDKWVAGTKDETLSNVSFYAFCVLNHVITLSSQRNVFLKRKLCLRILASELQLRAVMLEGQEGKKEDPGAQAPPGGGTFQGLQGQAGC